LGERGLDCFDEGRNRCEAVVSAVLHVRFPYSAGMFLIGCRTGVLKEDCVAWSEVELGMLLFVTSVGRSVGWLVVGLVGWLVGWLVVR
jgi:hypothetical protein